MSEPKHYSKDKVLTDQGGRQYNAVPGLFWYSGFGMGTYFSSDGKAYWTTSSKAGKMAEEEGVKFFWKDSFDGYRATYLGD